MKKYLCVGGLVTSQNDGQLHHVTGKRLVELYGLRWDECYTAFGNDRVDVWLRDKPGLIVLRPDPTGRYELPAEARPMSDEDCFWRAIELAAPDDQLPLLVAADWFEDHGKDDFAYALRWAAVKGERPKNWSGHLTPNWWLWRWQQGQRVDRMMPLTSHCAYKSCKEAWLDLAARLAGLRDLLSLEEPSCTPTA